MELDIGFCKTIHRSQLPFPAPHSTMSHVGLLELLFISCAPKILVI